MGVTAPGFSNRKALRIVLTAVALSVVAAPVAVALFVHSGADHSWTDDSLNGFGMWGVFVVYLWTRPPRKESLLIVAAAALVRAIHWFAVAEHPYPGCSVIGVGVYLPFFCIPPLAYRAFKGPKDSVYRLSLSGVLLFSYIGIVLGFYVSLIKLLCQFKLDNFLYAFDGALGPHFNFAIGQIALKSQLLGSVLTAVYNSLGFWMALLFAAHASIKNNKVDILKLTISNPVIGFALYFLYPAAGPKYAFLSFPQLPGHVSLAPALIIRHSQCHAIASRRHRSAALLSCPPLEMAADTDRYIFGRNRGFGVQHGGALHRRRRGGDSVLAHDPGIRIQVSQPQGGFDFERRCTGDMAAGASLRSIPAGDVGGAYPGHHCHGPPSGTALLGDTVRRRGDWQSTSRLQLRIGNRSLTVSDSQLSRKFDGLSEM